MLKKCWNILLTTASLIHWETSSDQSWWFTIWQPRSQGLSSLPPLVFLPTRPRKAEKKDPENEIDYLIDTKLLLKTNAVFNIFNRCSSWCSADALGQCVPVGSGISHTWWPACFACTTWNGKPLTGAPLINKQNEFSRHFRVLLPSEQYKLTKYGKFSVPKC